MFGNSLRMLCLFILTCLLLPHQILSKSVPLAEWEKQETAKVGPREVVKESEIYEIFFNRINALDKTEKLMSGRYKYGRITKPEAVQEVQDEANAAVGDLRLLASQLDVHDSPLLTVQQFEEISKKMIDSWIPTLTVDQEYINRFPLD